MAEPDDEKVGKKGAAVRIAWRWLPDAADSPPTAATGVTVHLSFGTSLFNAGPFHHSNEV